MPFANPWGLLALLGIPVVLYCHRRRAGVRRIVPLLAWWQPGPGPGGKSGQRKRLDLILLLRIGMVASLALALARPGWPVPASSRHVLIVDASASMNAHDVDGPRWEHTLRTTERVLDRLPPQAEAMLLRAGAVPTIVQDFSGDRAALRTALKTLLPGAAPKNLAPSLAVARRELGTTLGTVHVFSDVPTAQDVSRLAERVGLPESALQLHPVGGRADNLAIVRLEGAPLPQSPLDFEVVAVVANYTRGPHTVDVALRQPDGTRSHRRVALGAMEQHPVSFAVPAVPWVEVQLEGNQDALPLDDRATLVLAAEPTRVLYLSRRDRFLGAALRAHPRLAIHESPASSAPQRDNRPTADLAVVDGWVPPRDYPLPVLSFARPVLPALPPRLVPVTGWARSHPLLRQLDFSELLVPAGATVPADGETLIRSADGPILRLAPGAGPPRLECAFAVDRSTLGSTPAFPILIARAIEWLAVGQTAHRNLQVGQPLRLARPDLQGGYVIRRPDGSRVKGQTVDGSVVYDGTDLPGVYTLEAAGVRIPVAVRLVHAAESNLDRPAPDAVPAGATDSPVVTRRAESARLFLAIALPLLSIEAWLLQRQRRKSVR